MNGIYFSLSSKSIYPIIDSDLVREDFIYPYQLNVLYFLPMDTYKYALENKILSIKLQEVCKCSEVLECSLLNPTTIRLHIDCLKPIDVEVKQLSQSHVGKLLECVKKMAEVGREYWNPKGKLMRNIDQFVVRYYQNEGNQLVFYKMVESEFEAAINNSNITHNNNSSFSMNKSQISSQKHLQQHSHCSKTTITQSHLSKLQSLTQQLKTFSQACDIKTPPLQQIKQKYVRLFHKFVYNHLNQNWTFLYNNATQQELIMYSKKVYCYYVVVGQVYNDQRVKEGCRTLVKIVLGRFFKAVETLVKNFVNIEEESCRILKKIEVNNHNLINLNMMNTFDQHYQQQTQAHIFFSTFCTNLTSLISTNFHTLTQLPKSDQLLRLAWTTMTKIIKHSLQKLSILTQGYKQRSSLISVTNSLRMMRNKRLLEIFQEIEKSVLMSTATCKREKEEFLKQITNQIMLVETFCIKKLFVITFSSIDKEILKHQIPNIDFARICVIVIEEITKLQHILPDVRVTMFQSAFEEVCYFFYICVVKYDNSRSIVLTKDECLAMINMKMLAIRDSFVNKVQEDKIHSLLKDLNLLKQFITCPIHGIKSITRELKRVFGSNFTELNLRNLITLRATTLKQKQHLFEQCRQEIKTGSSYNSNQQLQSFPTQRQSFLNNNTTSNPRHSRRQRVSTLTQSLKSYTQHFDHLQSIPKKQRTILFGVDNSIYQGYIYRKKIIKNFSNTNYTRLFYRLKKGKLFQYDNQFCQDILNCYLLERLKKCYPQQERQQCFYLEFDKEVVKFKLPSVDDASNWIMKILQAMEEQRSLIELNQLEFEQDGVLFQDLEKKITFETKATQQPQSQPKNQHGLKMKKKQSSNQSPDGKVSLLSPKKTLNSNNIISGSTNIGNGSNNISNNNNNRKGAVSPTKLKSLKQLSKQKKQAQMSKNAAKNKRSKQKKGCGAGCNFF